MADLSYIDATLETKIVGQDSTGNRANYVGADSNGNMQVKDYADGPVTPGTAAGSATLIAGQFNTTLPTLTNTQQAAVQVDSSGRLLTTTSNISGSSDISNLVATNKMYSMGVEIVAASAGTNNPALLFRNPNGSGKTIYIFLLSFGTNVANVNVVGKIYSDPTVTANGTSVTTGSRYIGGGASAAVALLTTLPTVSANGTQLETAVNGENTNSVLISEDFSLAIAPNHSFLLTLNPLSNNRNVVVTIVWAEI